MMVMMMMMICIETKGDTLVAIIIIGIIIIINIFLSSPLSPGARGRKSHPCGVLCGAPVVI